MVERFLALFDGVHQADIRRHMAAEAHAFFARGLGHGVVLFHRQARMDLQQIPPFGFLPAHLLYGLFGRVDGVAVKAGAGQIQRRRDDLAAVGLPA